MTRYLILIIFLLLNNCVCEPSDGPNEEPQVNEDMTSQQAITGSLVPNVAGKTSVQRILFQPPPFQKAGNYTVQFKLRNPNDSTNLATGDQVKARATITWLIGGQQITRVVDVADGVSVTGVCESVNVSIRDVSSLNIATVARPYDISVSVGEGVRAPTQQPPTYALDSIAKAPGGGPTYVDVPQGAGVISVSVAVAPTLLGAALGAYQIGVSQVAVTTPLKSYDPRQSDWVPLMPGTTQIAIFLDAAAPSCNVQVTFGIDG